VHNEHLPKWRSRDWLTTLQVYFSANMQRQAISDAMTKGLYEKTRDAQEGVLLRWAANAALDPSAQRGAALDAD
jgi:hypothetical protein